MKLGLCFAGGGARGSYQVGVAMGLEELGILSLVEAYSGTSIGAVNAAFIATKPLADLANIWLSSNPEDIKKTESIFSRIRSEKLHLIENGIFEINKLKELVSQHVDYQAILQKDIYVTVSESGEVDSGLFGLLKASVKHYIQKDRKVQYIRLADQSQEDVSKCIVASCSIPIVFPAVSMEDKQFYDGGLYDNVPVTPLIEAGCDKIIVIHLQRIDWIIKPHFDGVEFFEIRHSGSLGGILHFDPQHANRLIEYGLADVRALESELRQFIQT